MNWKKGLAYLGIFWVSGFVAGMFEGMLFKGNIPGFTVPFGLWGVAATAFIKRGKKSKLAWGSTILGGLSFFVMLVLVEWTHSTTI